MSTTARIKWIEGVAFMGETGSGHGLIMDGAPASGGRNLGPRPMEMLLLGLGGCTSFDIVGMLEKMRQDVSDVSIDIEAERAEDIPKVFTKIHLNVTITGKGVDQAKAERAVALSAETYCSASKMLEKTAEITHAVTIVETP